MKVNKVTPSLLQYKMYLQGKHKGVTNIASNIAKDVFVRLARSILHHAVT